MTAIARLALLSISTATVSQLKPLDQMLSVMGINHSNNVISEMFSLEDKLTLVLNHISEVNPALLPAIQAKGRFNTREETVADLWQYNNWELEQALTMIGGDPASPIYDIPFVNLDRHVLEAQGILGNCVAAVSQVTAVLTAYLNAPPLWKYLPKMIRESYGQVFTPGPNFDVINLWNPAVSPSQMNLLDNPLFAFSEAADGEDAGASWEAARYAGTASYDEVSTRFRQAHPSYANYTMFDANIAIRQSFSEDQPDLVQLVDISEGRSAYCHASFFEGTIIILPESRVILRRSSNFEGVAEIIHPEGDAPIAVQLAGSLGVGAIGVDTIASPNNYLWVTIRDEIVGPSTTQKMSLKRDGLRRGVEASSLHEAIAGASGDHRLVTDRMPMSGGNLLLSESAGRIWFTNYDLPERPQSVLAPFLRRTMYLELLATATHPKQVLLRNFLLAAQGTDEQATWGAYRAFGKQIKKHRYMFCEILGIIYGDEDSLNGRLGSMRPADWRFTLRDGDHPVDLEKWSQLGITPELIWN